MDPWDDIDPYASSSGSRYGNPVSNFETPNKTKVNQTSRCIWGQADKSSPRTHNHPLNNVFREGELSCSRSAQGQWGKTNESVGGISCASTKNSTLYTWREQSSSYTAQCQWKNAEVPASDTYEKEESSYRSPWKNKNDCNSRNNVAAERASGLSTEGRLEFRRSLFDMDYEAETELETRDYHSGRNHNNVAESKLKTGSNCDGLNYVGGIKSDYDNLAKISLQEIDHRDLKKCDYYSDKSDDIDRSGKDDSSSEENYLVDIELAKRNDQLKKTHDCEREPQLRSRDDSPYMSHDLVVIKTELEESHDLVVVKTEMEERPDFEETFANIAESGLRKRDLTPDSEHVIEPHPKKQNVESDKIHKHPKQSDYHFDWSLLLGESDYYSDSQLKNPDRHLEKTDYINHGYPNKTQLQMKDNADNKKQPEKRGESVGTREALVSLVPGGAALSSTLSIPQASEIQKPLSQPPQKGKNTKHGHQLRPYRSKLPSGATLQLKKSDANALALTGQLQMKDNADNKKQPEKRGESVGTREALVSLVPGGAALSTLSIPQASEIQKRLSQPPQKGKNTKRDHRLRPYRSKLPSGATLQLKKSDANALALTGQKSDDTHLTGDKRSAKLHNKNDKNRYDTFDINTLSFLEQLEKIKEVSHTTDDNATKSCWDKKDNNPDNIYRAKSNINTWSFLEELEEINEGSHTTGDNAIKSRDKKDKSYRDENKINIWSFLEELEEINEVSHTTDDNAIKSRWDKKDKNYHDKSNRNKKNQLEKEEFSDTADDYVIKSRRDKNNKCQDKNYHDKNYKNKKDDLVKRGKGSHTADDYVATSRRDKKDVHRDKNYDKGNRNKKDELEKKEVSHTTDDYVTKSSRDKKDDHRDKNYDKDNRNKKDELGKKEVSHTTDAYVTKSSRDKKDVHRDKNYDKDNRNKKYELEKKEVSYTTNDYVTKSSRDKKDDHRDKNYDKDNRNKKDELEKKEVSNTTDDYATKSSRDKKDDHRDKNYDKDNRNNKYELEKKEVSHTTNDYVTKSSRDKNDDYRDKNYDKDNRNKKDNREKGEEVSHRTNGYVTKSHRDKKDNHRDKNCYDKGKDTAQKGLKIDIFAIKREVEENIRKNRMIKKSGAQLSDYSNVQSNPTAATLLGNRNCDGNGTQNTVTKTVPENQNNSDQPAVSLVRLHWNKTPKAHIFKKSAAQLSGYSNVQSNPTAATFLGSRKSDSNITQTTVTKTVPENKNNSAQPAVSLGQLHLNTTPQANRAPHKNSPLISSYHNPNFLLPGSKKKPLDTFDRMVLKKHLAMKLMAKDGVDFLQALGEKTMLKITVEKQMIKKDFRYACIFAGTAHQHKLEAQEAVERFLHPIGARNVIKTVPFKSDCSVTSLRENLRIIDSSDKYWTHLAGLRYQLVLKMERFLKRSTNINKQFDLAKRVQRNYSVLNALILGRLDVADGPKHMQILRQWLQESNVNSIMTSTIGFSFNYVFNYDSALDIDYVEVIQRFSNDGKLEEKLEISKMLRFGNDVCTGRGWMERLKQHKSLYDAVIISNYSADSVEQFKKNYSQLKPEKATPNAIHEISSKEESLKPNPELQIVNSYAVQQQPPQGHNFPYVGQYNPTPYHTNYSDDFSEDIDCSNFMIPNNQANLGAVQTYSDKEVPQEITHMATAGGESEQVDLNATEIQHLHCATSGVVEVQPSLGGGKKGRKGRNKHKRRKQKAAFMNMPLQHQSPANLLHFPHAQGVEPSQPPHGVNLASVALPYKIIPIMIPLANNVDSFILVPATAYKLFEAAGDDFLRTLCEQTSLKIDIIKEQGLSTVQYKCTLQGPDEEKPKAKAAIIKFCNSGDDVGS